MELQNKNSLHHYLCTVLSAQVLGLLAVGLLLGVYWTHCSQLSDILIGLGILVIALHLASSRERKQRQDVQLAGQE